MLLAVAESPSPAFLYDVISSYNITLFPAAGCGPFCTGQVVFLVFTKSLLLGLSKANSSISSAFSTSPARRDFSMRLALKKIIVLCLLPCLLLLSAGGALGLSLCVGLDGHVEIDSVLRNDFGSGHCDTRQNGSSFSIAGYECCGPCLDLPIQNVAHLVNRHINTVPVPIVPISGDIPLLYPGQSIQLFTAKLVTNPLPRISQSVLTHRTVVLQL